MLLELLSIVAPVFVMVGLGALWGRMGQRFDTEMAGSLVLLIGAPCLVYSSFTSMEIDLARFGRLALAAALVLAGGAILGLIMLRLLRQRPNVFLPALMHPNSGNMGIPVAYLAFGEQGLVLAISFFFIIAMSQYTLGFAIASGHVRWQQVVRQPIVWAVALSLVTLTTGMMPPEWVVRTTDILGGLTIPLMLILLGFSLARIKPKDLPLSFALAATRLGIGIAVGLATGFALGMTGAERGVTLLMATMPAAIFSFVFAERFKREPDKVASLVFVSTVLTLAIMPLLVWAALRLA